MARVLDGIRIADFTAVMAGASGAMFLGDLGADVIKVEHVKDGDYARASLPFLFQSVNRNKRSLALDLGRPEGIAVAKRLIATSDVVLQGYRPGALDAKGLGATTLQAENPRLIYASLSGFGSSGPGAGRRGIDQLVQAETGMADVMGAVNQRLGLVDAAAGIAVGQAVLGALFRREREGVGDEIEITLYDTALWLQMLPIAEYSVTRQRAERPATYELRTPTMGMFETCGGAIFMAVLSQEHWEAFCGIVDAPHLLDDPRFADRSERSRHGSACKAAVAAALLEQDRDRVLDEGSARGLMMTSVKHYEEVLNDPQAEVNGSFRTVPSWDGDEVVQVRGPFRYLSDDPAATPTLRPPMLGEHSREVLGELGYGTADVDRLAAAGIIGD